MKNNEYNSVDIINEGSNPNVEFSNAQDSEFSFYDENDSSPKDELNDNSVSNEKVNEEPSKKKEKQKVEKKEIKESSDTSTTSTSSTSSTASSAASGASAGAGASVATVVAAAAVSVTAIGSIVGVNVINYEQDEDLITFVSSEITTNSISFSFSISNKLLTFEQEEESDVPVTDKNVVYILRNSDGFNQEEYIVEFEDLNEEYRQYYASIGGLTPNTSYALDISIKAENDGETVGYQQLAYRTFVTQEVGQLIRFAEFEVSTNGVHFSFIVDDEIVGYDRENPSMPNIIMSISGARGTTELEIDSYEEYNETSLIFFGEFEGLSDNTAYTLTLTYSPIDGEPMILGTKKFTTQAKESSAFAFENVSPYETGVEYVFRVKGDYIGYTDYEHLPYIVAKLETSDGIVILEHQVKDLSPSGSTVFGMDDFKELSPSTSYKIIIYYGGEVLGESDLFTTKQSSYGFSFTDSSIITTNSTILVRFSINASEADYAFIKISGGLGYERETADIELVGSVEEGKYSYEFTFEELSPNITYKISVYNGTTDTVYGTTYITTTGPETGFQFTDCGGTDDGYGYNINFEVDASYVGYEGTTIPEMRAEITSANGKTAQTYVVESMYYDSSRGKAVGYVYATGLDPLQDYIVGIIFNNGDEEELLGVYNFTTPDNQYGFSFDSSSTTITTSSIEFGFLIKESEVVRGDDTSNIIAEISTESGTEDPKQIAVANFFSSGINGKLLGIAKFDALNPSTNYTITIFNNETSIIYGSKQFETEVDTSFGVYINPNASFSEHRFKVTLRNIDNVSGDLYLRLLDAGADRLGSEDFLLTLTTEEQVISVGYTMTTADSPNYDFELGDVCAFYVYNSSETLYSNYNFSFVDIDEPTQEPAFYGLGFVDQEYMLITTAINRAPVNMPNKCGYYDLDGEICIFATGVTFSFA